MNKFNICNFMYRFNFNIFSFNIYDGKNLRIKDFSIAMKLEGLD